MKGTTATVVGTLALATLSVSALAQVTDRRLREIEYDPRAVVTVPVKRGVVTLVVLDRDEAISDVAAGLGGDCGKAEAVWCIAAQAGGHDIFVKPKSGASAVNNLAVVTDRRTHASGSSSCPTATSRSRSTVLSSRHPSRGQSQQRLSPTAWRTSLRSRSLRRTKSSRSV